MNTQQREKMQSGKGFIAALDQSGGSTPKALKLYGLDESAYRSEAEMFDLIHAMRSRIIKSKAFNGERILGAILFEMTMNRQIDGMGTAEYLWEKKGVVPFLKIDNGLADEVDDVQLLKPIPELADRLASLGVERELLKRGAKAGDEVRIGNGDDAVIFDWEPTIEAGAELLAGPRGDDLRIPRGWEKFDEEAIDQLDDEELALQWENQVADPTSPRIQGE